MEAEWWTRILTPDRHYISLRINGEDEFPLRLMLPSVLHEIELIHRLIGALKDLHAPKDFAHRVDFLPFVYDAFERIRHEIESFTNFLMPGPFAKINIQIENSLYYYHTILLMMRTTRHHAFKECFAERLARCRTKAIPWDPRKRMRIAVPGPAETLP